MSRGHRGLVEDAVRAGMERSAVGAWARLGGGVDGVDGAHLGPAAASLGIGVRFAEESASVCMRLWEQGKEFIIESSTGFSDPALVELRRRTNAVLVSFLLWWSLVGVGACPPSARRSFSLSLARTSF